MALLCPRDVDAGMGNIIKKIIDSGYIGFFSSYWKIMDIEKCASNFIQYTQLVFHIPDKYEIVFENSASWTVKDVHSFHSDSL